MPTTGVLLAGFGGPDCLDAIGPFMTRLMGREPSDELLARVRMHYLAIGGGSPLPGIAASIAAKLADKILELGHKMPVEVGMCYSAPFIADALQRLKDADCGRVVLVSLSPFESQVAQQSYRDAVNDAAGPLGLEVVEAPLVSTFPEFAAYLASGTAAALSDLEPSDGAIIVFSAHSLPLSDLSENDPYVEGLQFVADEVARRLDLNAGLPDAGHPTFDEFRAYGCSAAPRAWYMVYQSKGNRPGEWLGPELNQIIDACAEAGVPSMVVCPIGFMTDHMETLYDLDIVAAGRALDKGVEFLRAPVPNDDENLVSAIARAVTEA